MLGRNSKIRMTNLCKQDSLGGAPSRWESFVRLTARLEGERKKRNSPHSASIKFTEPGGAPGVTWKQDPIRETRKNEKNGPTLDGRQRKGKEEGERTDRARNGNRCPLLG